MSRFLNVMKKILFLFYKAANKIIRNMKWYNYYWQGAQKFWDIKTFGIDVINLGSGAAFHDFNYSGCNVKGMNWALSPQSLVHDYNILRNYFSYLKEGACVIITVCPFSCLYSMYDRQSNFKYYTFLHPATIINFDDNEREKALSIKLNPFKEMPVKSILFTVRELLSNIKHFAFSNAKKKNLKNSADSILSSWMKQFGINDLNSMLSPKHIEEQNSRRRTLDEMINFCKERQLKPIIVIPPMHHTLTSQFTHKMINNYINNFLLNIDAPIMNYMEDSMFQDDNYFENALFLNNKGAMLFTRTLLEDIEL